MRWTALGFAARVAVVASVGSALAYALTIMFLEGYNAFAIVFQLVLLSLAGLAATGRWWGLAAAGVLNGLLAVVTASGQTDRLTDPTELGLSVGIWAFLILVATAAIAGITASVQVYRHREPIRHPDPDPI